MEKSPSQPREPLAEPPQPEFPFRLAVLDFCDILGKDYLIYADRYTGWVEVALMRSTTATTCSVLRRWFVTFGVPEEIGSDGGPQLEAGEFKQFLKDWGVRKRCSSAYYPQGNGRAELAVKAAKRILSSNVGANGEPDTDAACRALLSHRNTPVQDINMSPSEMLYGRTLKDHLPSAPKQIRKEWLEIRAMREVAMAKRHVRHLEQYNPHTRSLDPLVVGDIVAIQAQQGSKPTRWKQTGIIVEANPKLRQYEVKVDGSGRVTRRNRRFLRKIDPVCRTNLYPQQPPPENTQSRDVQQSSLPIRTGMQCEAAMPSELPVSKVVLTPIDNVGTGEATIPLSFRDAVISQPPRMIEQRTVDTNQSTNLQKAAPSKSLLPQEDVITPVSQGEKSLRRSTRVKKQVSFLTVKKGKTYE